MLSTIFIFFNIFILTESYLNSKKFDDSYVGRIVSMFHNIPTSLLGTYIVFDENFYNNKNFYKNELSIKMCSISVAFFLWDTIWQLKKRKKESEFILHGIMGLILNFTTYYYGIFHYYVGLLLLWEYTSFPLFYCWHCVKNNLTHRFSFKISSALLLVSHLFLRIILTTYIYFKDFIHIEFGLFLKIAILPLISLQYIWMYSLIKKAISIF